MYVHIHHVFKYPFCSLPTLNKLNIRNVSDKYVRFFSRGLYPVSDHIITVRIMKKNHVTKKQNQNSVLLPFLLVTKSKYIKKRKKFIPLRFSVLLAQNFQFVVLYHCFKSFLSFCHTKKTYIQPLFCRLFSGKKSTWVFSVELHNYKITPF